MPTNNELKTMCGSDLDRFIQKLSEETNFNQCVGLMKQIEQHSVYLSVPQLLSLSNVIDEDSLGLFNHTWGSLSFALMIKSKLLKPIGEVAGFPIATIIDTMEAIGSGNSGRVLTASISHNSKIENVAVKFLSIYLDPVASSSLESSESQSEEQQDEHLEELLILSKLKNSPYCVNVKCITIGSDRRIGLGMTRYCMDLHSFLHHNCLSVHQSLILFKRCVKCIEALHNYGANGIIHRNIKDTNFLIGQPNTDNNDMDAMIASVVIADFGFSKARMRETKQHMSGFYSSVGGAAAKMLMYAAPEVKECFRNGGEMVYTKSSDIYSLGVLLGFIYTKQRPYNLTTEFQILSSSLPPFHYCRDAIEQHSLVKKLFDWCTSHSANERPMNCQQILEVLESDEPQKVLQENIWY